MITQVETMINYDKPRWPRGTLATQAKTMMNYDNKDGHTAVPIGIMMRYLIYGFIAMSIPYEWVHDYSSTSILIWKLGRRGFTLNTHPLRKHLFQVHRSKKTSHRGRLCQIMVRFVSAPFLLNAGNRKSATPRPWRPWDSHSKWQAALGRCMVWTSKMGNLCIQENVVSQTK